MAYQNGTASTSTDLLQQLVTFLVAHGWTQDMSQVEGVGWRAHLHKSGNYVHLRARENEHAFQYFNTGTSWGIDLYLGTTFNSSHAWNDQELGAPWANLTTIPVGASMYTSAGPFTNYYFMTDSSADNVVVVCEVVPGRFVFIGWGLSLNKAGAITGGAYFYGSSNGYQSSSSSVGAGKPGYTITASCPGTFDDALNCPATYVRADVDSFTGMWITIGLAVAPSLGYTGKVGGSSVGSASGSFPIYDLTRQTSLQDGRVNLLPVILWVNRDGTSTGYSPLGTLPLVYASNGVGNGFSNASEYALGADTYKMFPNFAVLKVP